ncbi:MAG TPA: hypothetical protein IAB23_02800 [Candidatus Scybalocola faecavium]|nr:hypothetical protein [Candidatus Scybalocola faecavium]
MNIKVSSSGIKGNLSQMEEIKAKLSSVESGIGNVDAAMDSHSAAFEKMRRRITDIQGDLQDQIRKFAAMEDGLERALEYYFACENRVTESASDLSGAGVGGPGHGADGGQETESAVIAGIGIGGALAGFGTWFWNWINETAPEWGWGDSDRAKEVRQDKAMAESIKTVLKEERYTKKYWKKADYDERVEILTELFHTLNDILGINVREIHIEHLDAEPGYILNGYLSYYGNGYMEMYLNRDWVEKDSGYDQIISTLCHEMRHGYQHAVVDHPENYIVSNETVTAWRDNFNDYKTTEEDGYSAYRKQSVEADARSFSDKVI